MAVTANSMQPFGTVNAVSFYTSLMHTNEPTKPTRKPRQPKQSDKTPPPEFNPWLGDLDPAYIQWFKENHTEEEIKERYLDRIPL